MPKVGKKIARWDESDIVEEEIKYRLENWEEFIDNEEEDQSDEDEIRNNLYQDSGFWENEYENFVEYLSEIIQKKNPNGYWKTKVQNFGWRNLNGYKIFRANTGQKLLDEILPKTDCTFYIHNFGKGIAIQNFHHDSPVGNEWYYLKSISEKTYERSN